MRDGTAARRSASADPLLAEFLAAPDDARRDRALDALVAVAQPIVRTCVGSRLPEAARDTVDDVSGTVLVRVVQRLEPLRRNAAPAIASFPDYVAVVAYHAIDDILRQRNPGRARLKNRIRYVVTHDDRFALWERGGVLVCGFASHRGAASRRPPFFGLPFDAAHPGATVAAVLERAGGPIELDALAAVFQEPLVAAPPPEAPSQHDRVEWRERLARVWRELRELPLRQRQALLLNLRDEDGGSAAHLLPAAGFGAEEIAACLEMPRERLQSIWERLPLDDLAIAAILGVTRQQVINLRKAARARLTRRSGNNDGPSPSRR